MEAVEGPGACVAGVPALHGTAPQRWECLSAHPGGGQQQVLPLSCLCACPEVRYLGTAVVAASVIVGKASSSE